MLLEVRTVVTLGELVIGREPLAGWLRGHWPALFLDLEAGYMGMFTSLKFIYNLCCLLYVCDLHTELT